MAEKRRSPHIAQEAKHPLDGEIMNGYQNRFRILLWVLVVVAVMGPLMAFLAWPRDGSAWMPGGGMMAFGWLWMLVPLALMVAVMYGMMSMGHGRHAHVDPPRNGGPPVDARAVLDRRYASGDVPREDYLRMRRDLDEAPHR